MELTLPLGKEKQSVNKVDQWIARIISQSVICAVMKTKQGAEMEGAWDSGCCFRLGNQVGLSV